MIAKRIFNLDLRIPRYYDFAFLNRPRRVPLESQRACVLLGCSGDLEKVGEEEDGDRGQSQVVISLWQEEKRSCTDTKPGLRFLP